MLRVALVVLLTEPVVTVSPARFSTPLSLLPGKSKLALLNALKIEIAGSIENRSPIFLG